MRYLLRVWLVAMVLALFIVYGTPKPDDVTTIIMPTPHLVPSPVQGATVSPTTRTAASFAPTLTAVPFGGELSQ